MRHVRGVADIGDAQALQTPELLMKGEKIGERLARMVLVRERVDDRDRRSGRQAIWIAKSAGRSTINASGGMNCPSGSACPMLLAVFTATVEVLP